MNDADEATEHAASEWLKDYDARNYDGMSGQNGAGYTSDDMILAFRAGRASAPPSAYPGGVKCLLQIRDEGGQVVDSTEMTIPADHASKIIDRAAELVLAFRAERDMFDAVAELDDAVTAADVVGKPD